MPVVLVRLDSFFPNQQAGSDSILNTNSIYIGAHGVFTSYADWSDITAASFLSAAGKETPMFVRMSTVAGERGSVDTARDVHGFATRFYTDEGNFGILCPSVRRRSSLIPPRYRWQQHPRFLHPRRHPLSGSDPRGKAHAKQSNTPSCHST
jgi:hypothetical protein